VKDGVKIL